MPLQLLQGDAAVGQRIDVIGRDGERPIETGEGVGIASELRQHHAPIGQRVGMTRREGQQPVKGGDRILVPPQACESAGAIEQRVHVIGFDRKNLVEAVQGLVVTAEVHQRDATIVEHPCIRRADGKGAVAMPERIGRPAEVEQDRDQIRSRIG